MCPYKNEQNMLLHKIYTSEKQNYKTKFIYL